MEQKREYVFNGRISRAADELISAYEIVYGISHAAAGDRLILEAGSLFNTGTVFRFKSSDPDSDFDAMQLRAVLEGIQDVVAECRRVAKSLRKSASVRAKPQGVKDAEEAFIECVRSLQDIHDKLNSAVFLRFLTLSPGELTELMVYLHENPNQCPATRALEKLLFDLGELRASRERGQMLFGFESGGVSDDQ